MSEMVPTPQAPRVTLPPQEPLSAEQWERIARFLFDRLDDIDTVSDIAKDDDAAYRHTVDGIQRARFEVAETDGYRVVFRPPALRGAAGEDTSDG